MEYCGKCEQEYEREDGCLCPIYRLMMKEGHYNSVPPQWIRDWWDEGMYCGYCQSMYWPGSTCNCNRVPAVV